MKHQHSLQFLSQNEYFQYSHHVKCCWGKVKTRKNRCIFQQFGLALACACQLVKKNQLTMNQLTMHPSGELHVFRHNCNTPCVYHTQVGVLK